MKPKITIAIPTFHSNKRMLDEAIKSAEAQTYPLKEILVNECKGIGTNIEECMRKAKGKYIVYLCDDDYFTNNEVVGDIVKIFDNSPDIGVIGRYFYFFMDGKKGAIGTCREKNILLQSCCPSGMAFRVNPNMKSTNRIFIEMPTLVVDYLHQYRWTQLEYDTIAARFHPGGNTGTKTSYYTESPTQNWIDLLGENYQDFPIFITLKNRAPKLLLKEIWLHVRNDKSVLLKGGFWKYALVGLIFPSWMLRNLTKLWRNYVQRRFAKIIERPND